MNELVNCQMDFHGMVIRGFMPTPPEKKRDSPYKFHRQLKRQVGQVDAALEIKPRAKPMGIKPEQPNLWREKVQVIHTAKKVDLSGNDKCGLIFLQKALGDLWASLKIHDTALSLPRLNKMQDAEPALINMLSSPNITVADFKKALQCMQRSNWAKSFLECSAIQPYFRAPSMPACAYKHIFSKYLLQHIQTNIGKQVIATAKENRIARRPLPAPRLKKTTRTERQPQDIRREHKNPPQLKITHHSDRRMHNRLATEYPRKKLKISEPGAKIASCRNLYTEKKVTPEKTENTQQKNRLLAKLPAGQYPAAKNPRGHALEPRPAATKKYWYQNRINKGGEHPFTQIQVETPDGKQLFTAELVNTVPDEALKANGWTADAINGMKLRSKSRPMSRAALKALGCNSPVFNFQGRYYGEGSYGKVKPALITLPGSARKVWCVAKKVKINTEREFNNVLKETRLQAKSGVGPKIHGIADSINKRGQRQCIIFMEKLEGVEGDKFLKEKKHSITFTDRIKLAENLIHQVMSMHRNQVFHGDMKWLNSGVDPETLNVQLLDFGLGSASQHHYQTIRYDKGPGYCHPEWVQGRKNRHGYLDIEKVDVYSLGVMLGKLFGSDRFMLHTWSSSTLRNPQAQINSELHQSGINDRRLYALIEWMVQADPDKRPTMQEVKEQAILMKKALLKRTKPHFPADHIPVLRHCGYDARAHFNPISGYHGYVV